MNLPLRLQTSNYKKHTHWNPIQRILISYFYLITLGIIKRLKVSNVLDVGCGEGFLLEKLKKNGIGKNLEGVEFLKTAIGIGKKIHPGITIKQGSIYSLPYRNSSFDVVLCTEVLEHLDDPEKAYKEILRVTKKYCLISVPNEPFFMLADLVRFKNVSRWGNDPDHRNHWTYFSFKKFLKKEKVKIIEYKAPIPLPLLIVLIEKI